MTAADVDAYIAARPGEVHEILARVRAAVLSAAADGEEGISYQMPALRVDGRVVVHWAGWSRHVAIYPVPGGDAALVDELQAYKGTKDSLHFPYNRPMPYGLIEQVARQLVADRSGP